MPKQLVFVMLIEFALIMLTCILLMQPTLIFAGQSDRARSIARTGGLVFLCVTFCWSIILGCVFTLSYSTIQL
ncbi:MAG: hypothetical protein A3K03_05825 [Bdellovibrionales bacterium RIFOXYD1_FULL_44_7]|nr:MAG: hypothetical protein A3K03_05825 [Bdellovibrionales bacterium RIFOXYD1_FULL_44_7]